MNGSQVLLVDLVPSRRMSTKALLERTGFDVRAAATFADARRHLDRSPPDVLLSQLRLGANNGLHLVLRGRLRYPRMGAIVTTRDSDVVLLAEAERMGVMYLQWPVPDAELVQVVRSQCKHSAPGVGVTVRTGVTRSGSRVVPFPDNSSR